MFTRVLAAGDHFVLTDLLVEALHREVPDGLEISELTLGWPTEPFGRVAEVDEASGSEDQMIEALQGVEVCVDPDGAADGEGPRRLPRPAAVLHQPGRTGERQHRGGHRTRRRRHLRAGPQRDGDRRAERRHADRHHPTHPADASRTSRAAPGAATTTATTPWAPNWRTAPSG